MDVVGWLVTMCMSDLDWVIPVLLSGASSTGLTLWLSTLGEATHEENWDAPWATEGHLGCRRQGPNFTKKIRRRYKNHVKKNSPGNSKHVGKSSHPDTIPPKWMRRKMHHEPRCNDVGRHQRGSPPTLVRTDSKASEFQREVNNICRKLHKLHAHVHSPTEKGFTPSKTESK